MTFNTPSLSANFHDLSYNSFHKIVKLPKRLCGWRNRMLGNCAFMQISREFTQEFKFSFENIVILTVIQVLTVFNVVWCKSMFTLRRLSFFFIKLSSMPSLINQEIIRGWVKQYCLHDVFFLRLERLFMLILSSMS